MKIIKKTILLPSFIIIFFSMTIKPDSELPVLNNLEKQFGIFRNPIHTRRKSTEKSKNLAKPSIKDYLKKLSDPKYQLKIGAFVAGTAISAKFSTAMRVMGHTAAILYLYPKTNVNITIDFLGINFYSNALYLEINRKNVPIVAAAGPITACFVSSIPLQLLAQYNTTKTTKYPFFSGLKFGFALARYGDIADLTINFLSTKILETLTKKRFADLNKKMQWYFWLANAPINWALTVKLSKSYFVKNCSHLFY